MRITLLILASAALLSARAEAQLVPVHDRVAELCTVSSTDLVGQRLARKCPCAGARRPRLGGLLLVSQATPPW
jgi:hypothetical protein